MNVTFMIGNGFDINLGLQTQYTDFIKSYCRFSDVNPVIRKFKKEIIEHNLPLWANAELAFGKQTTFIPEVFTVEEYCVCHEHFCRALAAYLIEEQKKLVLNKENAMSIANNFSKAVNDVSVGFRAIPTSEIQSSFSGVGSIFYNFLNFNYTNALDRIVSETSRLCGWGVHGNFKNNIAKFLHVHGTVVKDMVLGVNDETQIVNIESFKSADKYNLAQLIKSQTDSMNEENTYKKAAEILDSSGLIYVYGMSLGETDKAWWKKICKLLLNQERLRIIIHSYDAPDDQLFRTSSKRYEDTLRNKLFDLGEVSNEQRSSSIQNRVYVTGENIFKDLNNIVVQRNEEAKAS